MKTLLLILLSVTMISISYQQNFVLEKGQILSTYFARNQSLLQLMYKAPEGTLSGGGESLTSLATKYYGLSQLTQLIRDANPSYVLPIDDNANLPQVSLRLPHIFHCIQYTTIDCVYRSYQQATGSQSYWKTLPAETQRQLQSVMKFPNYMIFVMNYLWDQTQNPSLLFEISITNQLTTDLTDGRVNFIFGKSETPLSIVYAQSRSQLFIEQSDIMHGIEGILNYNRKTFFGADETYKIEFKIFAGNGTLNNWARVSIGTEETIIRTGQVSSTSLSSNFVTLKYTKNPTPLLDIVFRHPTDLTVAGLHQIRASSQVLYARGTGKDIFAINSNGKKVNDLWKLIKITKTTNRFKFLNAGTGNAVEALYASSSLNCSSEGEENRGQIWELVDASSGNYFIKSIDENLCWHLNNTVPFENVANSNAIWLETCDPNSAVQKFQLLPIKDIEYS